MFTKVSVLIPTRARTERLRRLLMSYVETANAENSELVFRVDEDDLETRLYLTGWNAVVGPRLNGYGSLGTFFNEMAAQASGDVLMCGNDDMVFRTKNWAGEILAEANKYPDGLFNIGYSTFNPTHFPFSTVSRQLVEQLGWIWDPRIVWGDVFLRDILQAFNRCIMLPQVHIDHEWIGHNPDTLYAEGSAQARRDPTYWTEVHEVAVRDAVEKLQQVRKV